MGKSVAVIVITDDGDGEITMDLTADPETFAGQVASALMDVAKKADKLAVDEIEGGN
jgi:hypothetical protein